jgi:hypothetical protein
MHGALSYMMPSKMLHSRAFDDRNIAAAARCFLSLGQLRVSFEKRWRSAPRDSGTDSPTYHEAHTAETADCLERKTQLAVYDGIALQIDMSACNSCRFASLGVWIGHPRVWLLIIGTRSTQSAHFMPQTVL